MYVSLHSTRVQRFANSFAAGAQKRILGGGQLVPSGVPAGFPVTGLCKAAWPAWSVPSAPAGRPRQESWRGRSGFIPALAAPTQRHFANKSRAEAPAKTARRCGAPSPVPDSQTCRFHDSPLLGNFSTSKLLWLKDAGSAGRRARAGFGFSAAEFGVSVALDERRLPLPRPHQLKFRAHKEPGVLETGISGFPEGTEERRSRAPYFQWVLAAEARG